MVTKNQIKLVTSLQQKKYRNQHGLFIVEGLKTVREILNSELKPYAIFVDQERHKTDLGDLTFLVSPKVLAQMSGQSNPSGILGVFHIPESVQPSLDNWIIALDAIRDPGNLGTIIRLCDWFNVKHLVCSKDTVDCYNPKVLQATMGSIARVNVHYMDLIDFISKNDSVPVMGTFMDGSPLYKESFPKRGILIMGNEANGISNPIEEQVTHRIGIPQFGEHSTESLNVASATAILLSEIRRG
ncbi:TrmH family RNA methyltransferase [Flagellimonas meridianipacifica]|uniref:TrmH family RNA methyltransferase n=1 Tax=Flagellimonas meridianipacifica TaxID=1080225 RepID=A0A2T0MK38_9FLAO|nr:RNA methyltransferase [Allomuricauda pacifica]PRX57944.1 TrmH family RNA methyltransferase [Allomuricauda pacifica]